MKWTKIALEDLKHFRNLDVYLTVFLGVFVAILNALGVVDFKIAISAILATLALVAFGMLFDRHIRNNLSAVIEDVRHISEANVTKPSVDEYLFNQKQPPVRIDKLAQSAQQELWLVRETGAAVLGYHFGALEELLKKGVNIRLLTSNHKAEVVDMLVYRSPLQARPHDFDARLVEASHLAQNLRASSNSRGTLTVKRIDYSVSILGEFVDAESQYGQAIIRFADFRIPFEQYPTIHIGKITDPMTFNHYKEQFLSMWNLAMPVLADDGEENEAEPETTREG